MIRKLRRAKDITQSELAKVLGVERSTVAKWEAGVSLPRGKTLVALADALECTTDDILKGGGQGMKYRELLQKEV